MQDPQNSVVAYRLGKKSAYWATFTPTCAADGWQCQITARGRGGAKTLALLLETTPIRPLATITVRGETYPLTIGWHEMQRGGILCLGGERRTGLDGSSIAWEMRWRPLPGAASSFTVEMRVRATPRREGTVEVFLNTPLHQPEIWGMLPATARQHSASLAWSAYHGHSVRVITTDGEPGAWDEKRGGFTADWRGFSLGGGKLLRFSIGFGEASTAITARAALVRHYLAFTGSGLHPLAAPSSLDPRLAMTDLTCPDAFQVVGAERIYWKPPVPETGVFSGGFPHYPGDAMKALADWARFQPSDSLSRLIRFGAHALAADFQVMGREGESEPNKGAFWDRLTADGPTDYAGGATHGFAANARVARALFLLHGANGEPLLRQSALNICQWLILKQNSAGFFDGARVHATRGLASDGKTIPQECALDGAEAIRPFVLAYRATANEVFIKAAWKIANFLLQERLLAFDSLAPTEVASVLLALIALNHEAPNARLQNVIADWGAWLRALPLRPDAPSLGADGLHSGLYECADAGFALHALTRDTGYLRYAFAALQAVPEASQARSWHAMPARTTALLSLACLLPDAVADFDSLQVSLGWRVFTPDPATAEFLRVTRDDGSPVDFLPLVCRLNDQLLILALAPPETQAITILKNNRRPLVRDLLTNILDSDTPLHSLPGEKWAKFGLFTVDP
jgi:dienelactone hydrolase